MGRVCYGPSLSWAEFVMGRVCHGPSLLWAELSSYPREEFLHKVINNDNNFKTENDVGPDRTRLCWNKYKTELYVIIQNRNIEKL